MPRKVSPDTLQNLGVLAIGLGFMLIGVGGFSMYVAANQLELRLLEQKGEMNTQILTLLMQNQELRNEELLRRSGQPPAAPVPAPVPPAASYYQPPSPPAQAAIHNPPPVAGTQAAAEVASPAPAPEAYYSPPPPPVIQMPPPIAEAPAAPEGATPAPVPRTYVEAARPAPERVAPNPSEWREPESLQPELKGRYLSIRQRNVIANSLGAHGRHAVTMESSYGDPQSREYAEELGRAFAEADWEVGRIGEHHGLPLASGVTVSAASFPPQPETRAVYDALLSAGIAVTQQLDPKQHNGETVVLVGAPP